MVHTKVARKPQVVRGQNHGLDAFCEMDDIYPDAWPTTNRLSIRHALLPPPAHIQNTWAEIGTVGPARAK